MTFDQHSLDRLKKLGRRLPKEIIKEEKLSSSNSNERKKQKLHPVETENNPEQLFCKLMEISPDGNIPPHLLDRMKKLESYSIEKSQNNAIYNSNISDKTSSNDSQKLYTLFKQLLLEDEIN